MYWFWCGKTDTQQSKQKQNRKKRSISHTHTQRVRNYTNIHACVYQMPIDACVCVHVCILNVYIQLNRWNIKYTSFTSRTEQFLFCCALFWFIWKYHCIFRWMCSLSCKLCAIVCSHLIFFSFNIYIWFYFSFASAHSVVAIIAFCSQKDETNWRKRMKYGY